MVLAFSVAVMAAEKYAVSTKQLLLHHNKSSRIRAKAEQNPLIDVFISLSDTDCQPLKALGVKVNSPVPPTSCLSCPGGRQRPSTSTPPTPSG